MIISVFIIKHEHKVLLQLLCIFYKLNHPVASKHKYGFKLTKIARHIVLE